MKEHFAGLRRFLKSRQISRKGAALWAADMAGLILCGGILMGIAGETEYRFPVSITEVSASNRSYPNSDGVCCDFIEIHNRGEHPIDLTGFRLGDVDNKGRYAFPSGTVIAPDGYLVIYCSKSQQGDFYAPFEISRSGGELFYLIADNGAVVDSMTTIATDVDQSMICRDGQWVASDNMTPGLSNDARAELVQDSWNESLCPVRITEISTVNGYYDPDSGLSCDWIELYNTGNEAVDLSGFTLSDNSKSDPYAFPQGTVLEAGAYRVVLCRDGATDAAPFGLSQQDTEMVVLKDSQGRIVELVKTVPMGSGSMWLNESGTWALTDTASPGFPNTQAGHLACLEHMGALPGTIVISELMAADQAILPDSEGNFYDWVEILNTSTQDIHLGGWYLSDDPEQPDKWTFPDLTLQAGARAIIFCSGRDSVHSGEIHTNFGLSAGGESLTLSSSLGTVVDSVTFPENGDHCAYVFDNGSAVETAYPTPGYANDGQGYEAFCAAQTSQGDLAIWEVMTSNNQYLPQLLGACYDWVELKNVSDRPLNLSDYALSDEADARTAYALPNSTLQPGQSIVVLLTDETGSLRDGTLSVPFSLNAREDTLFLYSAQGELLDYVLLKDIPSGYSYGRSEDGTGFRYMTPTPKAANSQGYRRISEDVTANYDPGVYSGDSAFTVELSAPGTIHYTLDGSVPTENSPVYTTALTLSDTAVLRAISVENEKMASSIYTATFVVGDVHDLPVVSLVTDPSGLWGANGVYKNGDDSVKEIKLSANVAYSGEDGTFATDCMMNLHGATTVTAFDKKSFALRFTDACGGPLNYDVFEDGEVTSFRSLIIRTAHESTYSSQLHDAFIGHIASQASDSLITQKYKFVSLYLNGEYWGLYAIRERHSQEHYASYMEVPAEDVQVYRFATDNPKSSLYTLYQFCTKEDLTNPDNYAYVTSLLDVNSYADWIIFESYVCDLDIYGNVRYYYSPSDGLWRMGLADLDLGIMGATRGFDEMAGCFHHGRMISALMTNPDFQDLLATRLAQLLKGPLSDENVASVITSMAAEIRQEASWEQLRWGTPVAGWENTVQEMLKFCNGRSAQMIQSLCDQLNLTSQQRAHYFGDLE